MAIEMGFFNKHCPNCGHLGMNQMSENLLVEKRALDAWLEYEKCPHCGHVPESSIRLAAQAGGDPDSGQQYRLEIPLTDAGWDEKEDLWRRLWGNDSTAEGNS